MTKEKLKIAIDLAVKHHNGDTRKRPIGGTYLPYVAHPFAVMQMVWEWGAGTYDNMQICMCHDLIEDTKCTYVEIKTFTSKAVADGVKHLTFIPPSDTTPAELQILKNEYLKSFKTKPINTLIIKVADRICNVYDFMLTDPKYSVKYFGKAKVLFEAFLDRQEEISNEYGEAALQAMLTSYQELEEKIKSLT